MPNENPRLNDKTVSIGLMSRVDYGSDGDRHGLLVRAASVFRNDNVAFCVLGGGLVSGKAVAEKTKLLKQEQKSLERQIKAKERLIDRDEGDPKALRAEVSDLKKSLAKVEARLDALTPAKMAAALEERLNPDGKWLFTDAKGRPVKLYIIPSRTYDKQVGAETARILADKLGTERVRLLKPGGDRLPLWEGAKDERLFEILTTDRSPWAGDYVSTGVERRLKDKRKQTSSQAIPDLAAVGGYAVSILKPRGEAVMPFVAIPALYRIEDGSINENQIGVQVMVVHRDRVCPTLRSYTFKDLISRERTFIGAPGDLSATRQKCIDVLRKHGRCATGRIADETGLSKETVKKTLDELLATKDHKRYKTWPGLVYDALSDTWDFNLEWVKANLQYPENGGEAKTDVIVGFGCLHASSLDTDYRHFLTDVPKVMLERGANVLVGAGDFVEGLAHNMMLRGDIYAGLNLTKQEVLAGRMVSHVMMKVFAARFDELLKKKDSKSLTKEDVSEMILAALVMYCWIPGNHDLWITNNGLEPLVTMIDTTKRRLADDIVKILIAKGLPKPDHLNKLVESRVLGSRDNRFILPSGLRMAVMHPHMSRSKTTSIRPQEMLDKASDCQVVVGANFHVGEVVELWEPKHGQRICLQIGTMKHGSPFEDNKLKTVDQGFVYGSICSRDGRITFTETTFYSNDNAKPEDKRLDPEKPFNDFVRELGMDP